MKNPAVTIALFALLVAPPAWAQRADTVMVNGKILTVDGRFSTREAIAIRDGKIAALGSTADLRKLAGPDTRVIDLQGRTVIPGLIDSHLHAIRAALSFSTEVNWIGASSLTEAIGRIFLSEACLPPRDLPGGFPPASRSRQALRCGSDVKEEPCVIHSDASFSSPPPSHSA